MTLLTKLNRLSWKVKIALMISAIWLLYWIYTGWVEEELFLGLAFGGFPVFVVWGFWKMAVGSRKDKDLGVEAQIQATEEVKAAERRQYERLVYPPTQRPSFKFGQYELEIIDISERGLKLSNDQKVEFERNIQGEAVLLSGKKISVNGEVQWSLNREAGLLMDRIPSAVIDEEKRIVSEASTGNN